MERRREYQMLINGNLIENKSFDEERALYGSSDLILQHCSFDGLADGESALKESKNVVLNNCFFNLRYPLWHDNYVEISESEMTEKCRAALWYSKDVRINNSKLHGIKAVRECKDITIKNCDIVSPEFGWNCEAMNMQDSSAAGEYFMMNSKKLRFENVKLDGKYSFQYIENAQFDDCCFNTKDAFWHGKDIVVRNSVINGDYLAWYSEGLTLINCKISSTQPFCYCKDLKLINCELNNADLCFERSEVEAEITTHVLSIKNLLRGTVRLPSAGEVIKDIEGVEGKVITTSERS